MDRKSQFIRIIRETSDIEDAAIKCNSLFERELKQRSTDFVHWLLITDNRFEKFMLNKITVEELYDIFLKELKR